MALTHEDICRIAADLAYEEHMKQTKMCRKNIGTARIAMLKKR